MTIEIEPLIREDVLAKINRRIDNMAEARQMTREEFEDWSDRRSYKLDISNNEIKLILAYQTDKARQILNSKGKYKLATKLEKDTWWVKRFKDSFNLVDKAIKHLTDVCSYTQDKFSYEYHFEWLLAYDSSVADKMIKNSERGNKKSRLNM